MTPTRDHEPSDRSLAAWSPGTSVLLVVLALAGATAAAAFLEQIVGVADASPVYLIPVVVAAGLLGTWAAVGASVVALVVYDFLFTTPRFTLVVSDPAEWLSLLLFLIVAVVIGRLTGMLRDRADMADRRVREGVALVAISHDIAMSTSFEEAAAVVTERLRTDAEMDAVWVTLAGDEGIIVAATGAMPEVDVGIPWTLLRSSADGTTDWLRLLEDGTTAAAPGPERGDASGDLSGETVVRYVVAIEGDHGPVGWIDATRRRGDPTPGRGARRLLALAADQLGIALRRDQLRAEVTAADVARQSDALRGAILDSVSHDLRTPVASIRALAGGLSDPAVVPDPETVRSTAIAIDREGARLGDLVSGLLDMGRIQAGAVRVDLEPYELAELVETALRHHPIDPEIHPLAVEIPDDLPPVLADAVLFDIAIGNVLDNALQHTPQGAAIRLRGASSDDGQVVLTIDDAGEGVPPDALPHLFDRFYRVPTRLEPARQGLGMGLPIARGFVEAMGGSIAVRPGELGGLGVRVSLPAAATLGR